jgi:hypothetical protein
VFGGWDGSFNRWAAGKKIDRAWLEIDREAVVCEFEFGSDGVGQHVCRHVRENHAGTGDLRGVLD